MITPTDFIAKWGPGGSCAHLNEEQGAQSHFLDLCELLGVPKPGSPEVAGEYVFERHSLILGEARGYADVFYRDHFAWENKAPGKNLDAALRQLQQYSLALSNPPLLVVCDRLTIRIHTQFNGHPSETHRVRVEDLAQPDKQALLRRLWLEPESFRPRQTNRDITEAATKSFALLAEQLRGCGHGAGKYQAKTVPSADRTSARSYQLNIIPRCSQRYRPGRPAPGLAAPQLAQPARVDTCGGRGGAAGSGKLALPRPHRAAPRPE